jgi:protein-tyrosine kinase
MEKIEAALKKARAARASALRAESAVVLTAPHPLRPAERAAPKPAAPEDWDALRAFTPGLGQLEAQRIVAGGLGGALPPAAVGFDILRTKVLQLMRAAGARRLALTSPRAGCGKSTVALNLGFAFARQSGLRVILAEADLRRPALARMLGLPPGGPGFAEVLAGTARFDAAAWRLAANFAVIANPAPWPAPAELLQGEGIAAALEKIERAYAPDLVLFDLPRFWSAMMRWGFCRAWMAR